MQLDLDPVGKMFGWPVDDNMPAGDEEQTLVAFKKETAGIGERPVAIEGGDPGRCQEQRLDHGFVGHPMGRLLCGPVRDKEIRWPAFG